jgi:hypothetical protein
VIKNNNYLFLADQPLQASVVAGIAKKILETDSSAEIHLAFTDYYTFFLRKDFLEGFTAAFPGRVHTQRSIYLDWQKNENPINIDNNFLKKWEKSFCNIRTLDQIAKTNQLIFGDERNAYQIPMSKDWQNKILHDTLKWCTNLIELIQPNFIISVERCTLPTNVLYEIARVQKTTFLSIIPARLGSRWILVDDFGYGISQSRQKYISANYSDESNILLAKTAIEKLLENKSSAYFSIAHKIKIEFENQESSYSKIFLKDIRLFLGRVYGRIFIQPKERLVKSKRLSENFIKLSIYEAKLISLKLIKSVFPKLWGGDIPQQLNYFLWALHARPEGSVSVLGDGKDEIEELLKVAQFVPDGYCLVVKENPGMFGTRSFGFYRRLKKVNKIKLVDPFSVTENLIKNSLGVIGISGTILIEAAMHDKPSCALGNPEFSKFIVASGWQSAETFFNTVISEKFSSPKDKILPYISYLLNEGIEGEIDEGTDLEYPTSQVFYEKIADKIINYRQTSNI